MVFDSSRRFLKHPESAGLTDLPNERPPSETAALNFPRAVTAFFSLRTARKLPRTIDLR